MPKIKITKSPKTTGVPNQAPLFARDMQTPSTSVARTLKKVPREDANIEAEKGETVLIPNQGGLPAHFNIGGNRHTGGGTPLNVPKDSFVFSDTKKMRIKDPEILAEFGKSKGSWTPADLAKKYNINKFRKLLQDPDSDKIEISTAEKMIANYNLKLAKLALVQESKKGFPQGIPAVAMPYFSTYSIDPDSVLPLKPQDEQSMPQQEPQAKFGGSLPKAQWGWGNPDRRRARVFNYSNYGQAPWWNDQQDYNAQIEQSSDTGRTYNTSATKTVKKTVTTKVPPKGAIVIDYDPATKTTDQIIAENKEKLKKGESIYLKGPDGKYQQIIPAHADITTWDDSFGNVTRAKAYEYLKRTLKDEKNKPMIDKMYDNYKKHIQDSKIDPDRKAALLNKDKGEVLNDFLEAQKQVYRITDITGKVGPAKLKQDIDKWNTAKQGKNKQYQTVATELGMKPLNEDQIATFQAAYRGFQDISNDPAAADLKNFNLDPVGAADETGPHRRSGKVISTVDDYFGAATAGQAMLPTREYTTSPFEGTTEEETDVNKNADVQDYTTGRKKAPFWLQDVINTTSAVGTRLGLKKYLPWAAKIQPRTPEAYFLDPTRELAANAEQMDIGTRGAGIFSGPQAYNARFSQIQGQGAKNAANILSRYHNENIGIANKFSALKADIYNKADQTNAAIATDLYNKTTVANQQFDNAKRQANSEIRKSFVNAITNRAQAQTLNMMYPHFQVDPIRGGYTEFYKGDEMAAGSGNSPEEILSKMQQWKDNYPGWEDDTYSQLAGMQPKKKGSASDFAAYQQMLSGVGNYGG